MRELTPGLLQPRTTLLFSHYLPTVLCNCGSSWAQKSESELCQQWTHKDYFTCILVHRICRMWMLLSDTMSYTSKNRQCMTKIWPSRNEDVYSICSYKYHCKLFNTSGPQLLYRSENCQCMTKILPSRNEDGMYTQYVFTRTIVKFSIPAVLKFRSFF